MARIADNFVDKVKEEADLYALVNSKTKLKKAGKEYKALCCFHEEKSPSLYVNTEKNEYHCHGCGAGGGAINFIMETERLGFRDALKELVRRHPNLGPIVYEQSDVQQSRPQTTIGRQSLEEAVRFFQNTLQERPEGLAYARSRGLSDEDISHFGVGFAPAGWDSTTKFFGSRFSWSILHEVGLLNKDDVSGRYFDFFSNRLMFPVRDGEGRTVAFTGRNLVDDKNKGPKYKNSPDSPVFSKSRHLYGLYEALQARQQGDQRVDVVEGPTDVIAGVRQGFTQTIAGLGTSLGVEQLQALARRYNQVNFVYDGDQAGQMAATRAILTAFPIIDGRCRFTVTMMPAGEDLDSLLSKPNGLDIYRQALDNAKGAAQYYIDYLVEKFRLRKSLSVHADRRGAALHELRETASCIENPDYRALLEIDLQQRLNLINRTDVRDPLSLEQILPAYYRHMPENARGIADNTSKGAIALCGITIAKPHFGPLLFPFMSGSTTNDQHLLHFTQELLARAEKQQCDPLAVLDNNFQYLAAWMAAPYIGKDDHEIMAELNRAQAGLYAQLYQVQSPDWLIEETPTSAQSSINPSQN